MRASLIVIGAAFLFTGGLFLAIAGNRLIEERRYEQRGVRVDAIALDKNLHRATDDSGTRYELEYRFRLASGEAHERSQPVPVHVWERIEVGMPVAVEYLRGEPSSVRVVKDDRDREPVMPWLPIGAVLVLGGLAAIKRVFKRDVVDTRSAPPPRDPVVAQEPSFWPLARRTFGFWFGGMILLVGLFFFLAGVAQLYIEVAFARTASVTNGIVLTKDIKRSGKQNRTKRYEATYRYTVAGNTFEGRDGVSFEGWKALNEREESQVLFLPQRPTWSRLAVPRPWLVEALFALIGALVTGIGGSFFIGAIRYARLEWRLRQSGVSTPGTVVELRERNIKINGVRQWRLHYQYRDLRGHAHDKTIDVPEDEAHQWKVGDAGKVLYDSAQPGAAVWLGRS